MSKLRDFSPIAVIGMASIFPGSQRVEDFWRDIVGGKDLITEVPEDHWLIADYYDPNPRTPDKTYCKRGGFLSAVDFNPMEFGIPPSTLPQVDTSQLLGLKVAKQLLLYLFGDQFDQADLSEACVILGATSTQELVVESAGRLQIPMLRKVLNEAGVSKALEDQLCERLSASYVPWTENTFPGLLGNVISGRIANRFNFGGTNCVTDAACASSVAALSMAIDELHLGRANLAITGGVDTLNDIFAYICFSKTPALSFSGDCRPFAKNADGTLLGEGIGFLALKRLEDAEREGNTIHAVIRGLGSSSDGKAKSVYAPVARGQAKAIIRSMESAGITPDSIELLEGHGTATAAGDRAEIEGLKLAFADPKDGKAFCALGSVKSQIGHTKAAAGAAALIKTTLALRHKTLPPTIKVDEPNPKLNGAKAFYVNTKTRPWVRSKDHPRRAGVSSFGFGGTNFHVIMEEYLGPGKRAPRLRSFSHELLLFSAPSVAVLIETLIQIQAQSIQPDTFHYLVKQSQQRFSVQHPARIAMIAADANELAQKLQQSIQALNQQSQSPVLPKNCYYAYASQPGKVAFLFPGQGSQYVNMGADVLMGLDAAQEIWDEMDSIALDPAVKLNEVVFPAPVFKSDEEKTQQEQLAQTQWTQPALAVTELMYLELLQSLGVQADCYAGHSFGELVALYAAGVFDATTLVKLARERGELMAAASQTPGAMTAVIYPQVAVLLEQIAAAQIDVVAANFNCPQQTVFSGAEAAITTLEQNLSHEKVSFHRLPVSSAFHSPLVAGAKPRFLNYLQGIKIAQPNKPVYANATAAVYPVDAQEIRALLAEQLVKPVRFVSQIEAMYAAGVRTFIEVGPQGILSNFVNKILADKKVTTLALDNKKQAGMLSLYQALGQLAVNGLAMDLAPLWKDYEEPELPKIAESTFNLQITGANYGKPALPQERTAELTPEQQFEPKRTTAMTTTPCETTETKNDDRVMQILGLYQKLQEEVGKAHREYQELAEKSHLAYLDEARSALDGIRQLAMGLEQPVALPEVEMVKAMAMSTPKPFSLPKVEGGAGMDLQLGDRSPARAGGEDVQVVAPAPVSVEAGMASLGASAAAVAGSSGIGLQLGDRPPARAGDEIVQVMAAAPGGAAMHSTGASAAAAGAAVVQIVAPVVSPASSDLDPAMQSIILNIVAEKTGYPQETINMDMDLEADLGIDSIKRVEILSAMQNEIPNLPELDPADLATLHTFKEIAHYLKKQQGA